MSQSINLGVSFLGLPLEMREEVYRLVFKTQRISRVHVRRVVVYVKRTAGNADQSRLKQRFVCPSRIMGTNKECRADFHSALEKHAFTTATAIVMDVTDLDFRGAIAFLKTVDTSERARLDKLGAPKLVVRLDLVDVRAFDGIKLASWLAFSSKCGLALEYEVGEIEEPEAVSNYFVRMTGLGNDTNFLGIMTAVWHAKEGVKKSVARGSLLSSLIGLSDGEEEEEEDVESSAEADEDEEESADESDLDSENMSSEEDFTDEEDDAEDGGEGDE